MSHADEHLDPATLSLYHDGEGSPDFRSLVESHLVACDACRAELARLHSIGSALRDLPELQAPPSLLGGVRELLERERVRSEETETKIVALADRRASGRPAAPPWLGVAAATLLTAVALWFAAGGWESWTEQREMASSTFEADSDLAGSGARDLRGEVPPVAARAPAPSTDPKALNQPALLKSKKEQWRKVGSVESVELGLAHEAATAETRTGEVRQERADESERKRSREATLDSGRVADELSQFARPAPEERAAAEVTPGAPETPAADDGDFAEESVGEQEEDLPETIQFGDRQPLGEKKGDRSTPTDRSAPEQRQKQARKKVRSSDEAPSVRSQDFGLDPFRDGTVVFVCEVADTTAQGARVVDDSVREFLESPRTNRDGDGAVISGRLARLPSFAPGANDGPWSQALSWDVPTARVGELGRWLEQRLTRSQPTASVRRYRIGADVTDLTGAAEGTAAEEGASTGKDAEEFVGPPLPASNPYADLAAGQSAPAAEAAVGGDARRGRASAPRSAADERSMTQILIVLKPLTPATPSPSAAGAAGKKEPR